MRSTFPKGSEWCKWDLQASTNYYTNYEGITLSIEQTKNLEKLTGLSASQINSDHRNLSNEEYSRLFVEYLVHLTDLAVVAITNHNTGEGIQEILDYLNHKKDSQDGDVYKRLNIFPGVEIGGNDRCHVLIIFNPLTKNKNKYYYDKQGEVINEKTWKEYIEDFLNAAHIPSQRFLDNKPKNSSDLGVLDILNLSDQWEFIPIMPHINNSDGWAKELQDSNRLETYAHPMFGIVDVKGIGNNNALKRILDGLNKHWYNKEVAQIYTSDAKKITEIGKHFTWIKADPTFEGLRQIIYEPQSRVSVSDENPDTKNKKFHLSKLILSDSNNFPIANQILEINRDLVCIIGGRGSGKSALFESIAYCFDEHDSYKPGLSRRFINGARYELDSFIDHHFKNKSDFKLELIFNDLDGNALEAYITTLQERNELCSFPILYLGQNKIENFARSPEAIHHLAFDTVIKNTSQSTSLASTKTLIDQREQLLAQLNKDIEVLRSSIKSSNEEGLTDERKRIANELQLLASQETREIIDEFNSARVKLDNLRQLESIVGEIGVSNPSNIGAMNLAINRFEKEIQPFIEKVNELAKKLDIIDQTITLDLSSFKTSIEALKNAVDKIGINNQYTNALEQINEKLKGKTDLSVSYLESQKNRESEVSNKILQISFLKEQLLEKESEREKLMVDFQRLYDEYARLYGLAIQEFSSANKDVLKSVHLSAAVAKNIYALIDSLYEFADKRKVRTYEDFIDKFLLMEDLANIGIHNWIKVFKDDPSNFSIFNNLSVDNFDEIVYKNYFSLETNISYEVMADDIKPINKLSLGQKGTVLLKFYLSSGNNCPIFIDQPEDHLDNDFIYKDLVKTIRAAKVKRQIVLVTHDANLVVNGDAEQVIVAQYADQRIKHEFSGSLEDPSIRDAVSRILEGGEEAFKKREKKYQYYSV